MAKAATKKAVNPRSKAKPNKATAKPAPATKPATVEQYLLAVPSDQRAVFAEIRNAIKSSLPKGFVETMQYGMISYVVPLSLYPAGYHCKPTDALPFLSISAQKRYLAVYHMGIYAQPELSKWFTTAYAAAGVGKLDMGKSCIRLKPTAVPLALLKELAKKMTPKQWIELYERQLRK